MLRITMPPQTDVWALMVREPRPISIPTGGGDPPASVVQAITNAEIMRGLAEGGYIRGIIVEAQDRTSRTPSYAVYVLATWRPGYSLFNIAFPHRPRFFRDLDRLMELIRFELQFEGNVNIRLAGDRVGQKIGRLRSVSTSASKPEALS